MDYFFVALLRAYREAEDSYFGKVAAGKGYSLHVRREHRPILVVL